MANKFCWKYLIYSYGTSFMYSFSFLKKWSIYTVTLFVLEWPRWPLYQKGVRFYKKKMLFCKEYWIKGFETSHPFFKECTFYQLQHFFLSYGYISVWIDICILNMFHYLALTFYHLTFGFRFLHLDLYIWNHLSGTLKAKLSFQWCKTYLNDWFWLNWMHLLKVSKNGKLMVFYYLSLVACILCCHVVCNFLSFQLLAKMLNFIFTEYTWKFGYLRWCYMCFFYGPYYPPWEGVGCRL